MQITLNLQLKIEIRQNKISLYVGKLIPRKTHTDTERNPHFAVNVNVNVTSVHFLSPR